MNTSLTSRFRLAAATLMLLALSACAQSFNAKVNRFQAELPAPAGQTFTVVADDPAMQGGIEFSQYARLVEAQMVKLGYVLASPATSQLLVRFDYGVDKGRQHVRSTGFANDPFYNPWFGYRPMGFYGNYWGRPGYYGRPNFFGSPYYGGRGAWGYGWYDPWMDGGYESYSVYTSSIGLKIDRKDDGRRLFEGKAEAASTTNRLPYLVPNLIEAMFTGFPGRSGETVRITVAPEKKRN